MSNNPPLPATLPSGSEIFIPDPNGEAFMNSGPARFHRLTSPVHVLTPEMAEAVRREVKINKTCFVCDGDAKEAADDLAAAFSTILDPPKPVEGEKTCRDVVELSIPTDDPFAAILALADRLDALTREVRRG